MYRVVRAGLAPWLTLLEIHGLLHFMQVARKRLSREFNKGPYGPYAENPPHDLSRIRCHLEAGFRQFGVRVRLGRPMQL